jgi:septal ring factor EnvC (AmiA/AmiB activator)
MARTVWVAGKPHPRPAQKTDAAPAPDIPLDLSKALPGTVLAKLPSSAQALGALKAQLAQGKPALDDARQKSDALAKQAQDLRAQLIATAARIQDLEQQTIAAGPKIAALEAQDAALTQSFARDRISVTRLLAILERLQHDMPPALAVRPDDALAAARGAMLVGDTLPPVYARASDLARRIDNLRATRQALVAARAKASATAAALAGARGQMEQLSAQKDAEAAGAARQYGGLKAQLDAIGKQAADFQSLVNKVAQLRRIPAGPAEQSIVTVTAQNRDSLGPLTKGSLMPPVAGTMVPAVAGNGKDSAGNPGVSFASLPGAQVVAPADGKVLFAGPYHKSGQVLILEITTGYDLVLAGLGRIGVKPNDELLAGEPVGNMPMDDSAAPGTGQRLYFELRQNGHGLNPLPWLSLDLRKAKKA